MSEDAPFVYIIGEVDLPSDGDEGGWKHCSVCFEPKFRHRNPKGFVTPGDEPEGGPLSKHEIEYLRFRYSSPVIPPCRVCGSKLEATSMGGGEPTKYHCSSDEARWLRPGEGTSENIMRPGLHPRYDHYRESEHIQRRHGDYRIGRLLDEYVKLVGEQ